MENLNWTYILFLIVSIPASINLIAIAKKDKSLSSLFFGLSLISFVIGILIEVLLDNDHGFGREWGDLIAITLTLSALFIKTRNSKPVFARFPLYLTLMPFLVLFFYPFVVNAQIVKELLQITYQGAAIIVGILVISINHYLYKERGLLLFSCILLLFSFVLFWFFDGSIPHLSQLLAKIIFSFGIIVASIGFKKISDSKNTQNI